MFRKLFEALDSQNSFWDVTKKNRLIEKALTFMSSSDATGAVLGSNL